jgi:hypothetical protein
MLAGDLAQIISGFKFPETDGAFGLIRKFGGVFDDGQAIQRFGRGAAEGILTVDSFGFQFHFSEEAPLRDFNDR